MVSAQHKDIIVNAIRLLRARRVRPSFNKIASLVLKEHSSLSEKTLQTLIEALLESNDLLKVHFKGAISYRVPRKVPDGTEESPSVSRELSSDSEVECVTSSFMEEVTSQVDDSRRRMRGVYRRGASVGRVRYRGSAPKPRMHAVPIIKDVGEGTSTSIKFRSLTDTIDRVVHTNVGSSSGGSNGSVTPMSGRSTPTMEEENQMELMMAVDESFETPRGPGRPPIRGARRGRPPLSASANFARRGRPLSARTKRARRVYDPSEGSKYGPNSGYISQVQIGNKRGYGDADMTGPLCQYCQTESMDARDEFMLTCNKCSTTSHPSCLGYSPSLADKSRRRPWTCMECKHCSVCDIDHTVGTLIFCDDCDRAYHLTCHQPPLTNQPKGSWVCGACKNRSNGRNSYEDTLYSNLNQSHSGGFPLTPRDSPIPDDESRGSSGGLSWQNGGLGIDPSIPNALNWSQEEVFTYFQQKGFQEEASLLREQAIDGSALMLLSRTDVLKSLSLKLGPAVKLYKQVRILQTRIPNPPTHY